MRLSKAAHILLGARRPRAQSARAPHPVVGNGSPRIGQVPMRITIVLARSAGRARGLRCPPGPSAGQDAAARRR